MPIAPSAAAAYTQQMMPCRARVMEEAFGCSQHLTPRIRWTHGIHSAYSVRSAHGAYSAYGICVAYSVTPRRGAADHAVLGHDGDLRASVRASARSAAR